ncbi:MULTISPECIES: SgcJ/EcaC family oxidoreductase [Thioalkalivibrio]|uniref:SgcJ/EcaC family oxidoreductase n=1 Tax=Thioalkalivibrio TaxID=106633 RepID=UPI00038205C2|nr:MULTISPECIES: SgcJ/EcaC family oxidoreductase [Thioalkalivibrio]
MTSYPVAALAAALLVLVSGTASAGSGDAREMVCAPVDQDLALERFETWNDALQTGDAARVTELYAEDAVLLPTVSRVPRTNHAEIQNYFEHFLESRPYGTIDSRNVRLGCNQLTDVGIYTFRMTVDGETEEVQARYTFAYEHRDGQWRIAHHHSSKMPAD